MAQAPRPASINDQESRPWPAAKQSGDSGQNDAPLREAEALALRHRQSDVSSAASESAPKTRLSSAEINKIATGKGNDIPDRDVEIQYPHSVLWRSKEHLASELKERSLAEGLISKGVSEEAAYKAARALFSKIDAKDASSEAVLVEGMAAMFNTLSLKEEEISLPPIPTEKYVGNRGGSKDGENIVEFLSRVWGDWFVPDPDHEGSALLTRPLLLQHDKSAYTALGRWLRDGNEFPIGLHIPNKSDLVMRRAAQPCPSRSREAKTYHAAAERQRYARSKM